VVGEQVIGTETEYSITDEEVEGLGGRHLAGRVSMVGSVQFGLRLVCDVKLLFTKCTANGVMNGAIDSKLSGAECGELTSE